MKVAIVAPYSLSIRGGVGTHVSDLAASLREAGHPATVLGPLDGPAPDPWVHALGRSLEIPINGSMAHPAFSVGVARRVRAALAEERPDVLHVHEPLLPSAPMLAALLAGTPTVATFHAAAPANIGYRVAGPILRGVAARFDVVTAVSAAAAATIEPVLHRHCRIIPNGLRTAHYAAGPRPDCAAPTVLFLGRLEARKGLDVLLAAWPGVRRAVPRAVLHVAGTGARGPWAQRFVHLRVKDLGVPADAAPLYRAADVYAAPATRGESFGYVLLEAMAAGTPVVAAANAGYASVVTHGVDGLLVPPGDADALARGIAAVFSDQALRERLVAGGRATAARYDWAVLLPEVLAAYDDAIAARATATRGRVYPGGSPRSPDHLGGPTRP